MSSSSNKKDDDFCFLKVSIAGNSPETVAIKLFNKECPKTCNNFLALVSDVGATTTKKTPYPTYRGCEFHRIIDGFMVQTGDFERFDGTGGYSPIYTGGKFPDESFAIKHDNEGIVSMANSGKNTNGSQFFITLKATPHLDGKHVAFGQVIAGMNIVHQMINVERVNDKPVPMQRIMITDCGIGNGNRGSDEDDKDNDDKKEVADKSRKEDKKKKRKKEKKKKTHKKDHKKRHRSRRSDSSDSDDDRRKRRKKSSKRKRKRSSRDRYYSDGDDSDDSLSRSSRQERDRREHRHHSSRIDDKRNKRQRSSRDRSNSRSWNSDDYSTSSSKGSFSSSSSSSRHRRKKSKSKR